LGRVYGSGCGKQRSKEREADRRTKPAPAEVKSMSILRCTRLGCGVGLERILTCAFIVPLLPHGIA